jgi:hypothetical protein
MLGVYGHEQRHVQNWLSYITGTMVPALAVHEAQWRTCCPSAGELRDIELAAINGFRARIDMESSHSGPPFNGDPFMSFPPVTGTTPGVIAQFYDSL